MTDSPLLTHAQSDFRAESGGHARIALRLGVAAAWCALFCFIFVVGAAPGTAGAHAPLQTPGLPLGSHCIGVGPGGMVLADLDDPAFCGCTYGHVWYMGRPVEGALVTVTLGADALSGPSRLFAQTDPLPFYSLSAKTLGARRGDIITLTASYAGQSTTRTLRAWPHSAGEQQVDLVIPAGGAWRRVDAAADFAVLVATDNSFWAAGASGMVRGTLAGGPLLPLAAPPVGVVRALAVDNHGVLWAGGSAGLAHLQGAAWLTETLPTTAPVRAIAAERTTGGALWVGGGENSDGFLLTNRSGAWTAAPQPSPAGARLALAVDADNTLWASFYGHGLAALQGNTWQQWTPAQGLFSNYVTALAVDEATPRIWAGGLPMQSASLGALTNGVWRSFGVAQGLPAHPLIAGASTDVTALAHEAGGALWVGTQQGLYLEHAASLCAAGPDTDAGREATNVRALAAWPTGVVVAAQSGLWLFDRSAAPPAPVVSVPAGPSAILPTQQLTLTATATPSAGSGLLVAWEWMAGAEPLCTTAAQCVMPGYVLDGGATVIRVRVQDVLGHWSAWTQHALDVRFLGLLPIVTRP